MSLTEDEFNELLSSMSPEDRAANADLILGPSRHSKTVEKFGMDVTKQLPLKPKLETHHPVPVSPSALIITIPGEQPMSWNELYSGKHWRHRSKEAKRVHGLVREHLDPNMPQFTRSVDISLTVYRKNRIRFDPDNVCSKFYIDGLVPLVIADDNFNCVNSVKTAVRIDRGDPRLVIEVRETYE